MEFVRYPLFLEGGDWGGVVRHRDNIFDHNEFQTMPDPGSTQSGTQAVHRRSEVVHRDQQGLIVIECVGLLTAPRFADEIL